MSSTASAAASSCASTTSTRGPSRGTCRSPGCRTSEELISVPLTSRPGRSGGPVVLPGAGGGAAAGRPPVHGDAHAQRADLVHGVGRPRPLVAAHGDAAFQGRGERQWRTRCRRRRSTACNDGRYLQLLQNHDGWGYGAKGPTDSNSTRRPQFIALGEYRPDAHQPIWFSDPVLLFDTNGVGVPPFYRSWLSMYASLTELQRRADLLVLGPQALRAGTVHHGRDAGGDDGSGVR